MSKSKANFILYRGPSMIDGSPIVAVVTGLSKRSTNTKTGKLAQVWILRDDMSPVEAIHSGADVAICGSCVHRGTVEAGRNVGRSCYVTVFQAPLVVFKAVQRGYYPVKTSHEARLALAGKRIRIGAYGDPAAVPFWVWAIALQDVEAVTGYTHAWRTRPELRAYCMASCDTGAEYLEAKRAGWRTFRVRPANDDAPLNRLEVACPASKEMGAKTTCAACVACGGSSSKARVDIAIMAHGAAAKVKAFEARA